jgi:hypothetical protein
MAMHTRRTVFAALIALWLCPSPTRLRGVERLAAPVHPLFDLTIPSGSPFPTNRFSVRDDTQNTGLRVNLPKPDCVTLVSDECSEIDLLNEIDGFNIQPRISIPFSGPIDPSTASTAAVFLVRLGNAMTTGSDDDGDDEDVSLPPKTIGLNQLVWDVETRALHGTADEILEQHSRYGLIVTRNVQDASGNPIEPSRAFERFRQDLSLGQTRDPELKAYRKSLLRLMERASALGIHAQDIAVASVFTTQSVSAILEKIRDQIKTSPPKSADFNLAGPAARTVFRLDQIATITLSEQITEARQGQPPTFATSVPRLPMLRVIPGAVETLAAGKFASPMYTQSNVMPALGTRTGEPQVFGTEDVYFTVFLPSGAMPRAGWPVVIFGDGQPGGTPWGSAFNVAATLATRGLATVSMQPAWHGFGPLSSVAVRLKNNQTVTFPSGGRNSDKDGDGDIEAIEGVSLPGANRILGARDAFRQSAADAMQFVRVLEGGVDVDGDHAVDLDPSRVYYLGFSGGSWRGVAFVAVEPSVRAAVFNSGSMGDVLLSPVNRSFFGEILAARVPSLINPPGTPIITAIDGVPVDGPFFNENMPLRNQPVLVNTVPGAMRIQEWFERRAWIRSAAEAGAFAPYLRKSPLHDVASRPVLLSFARGDQTVPNPAATALVRAGELTTYTTFFRTDIAIACDSTFEKNNHSFLVRMNAPTRTAVALAAQQQVAEFFASDGNVIINPDDVLVSATLAACGSRFFEVPIVTLPEDLGFIK